MKSSDITRCTHCRSENPATNRFCSTCGAPSTLLCPKCDHANTSGSRFCSACGHVLVQEETSEPAAKPEQREATASGERRQVTVMFSDISGYTALTERLDPEDVNELLRSVQETAAGVIKTYGGTINQFIGDEVMIVFGIPVAQEDDPMRAIKAARELHARFRDKTAEFQARTGERLAVHTGISTGLVFAQYRNDREGLYQLTGDAVNTAARLRSLADADEVLIGPATQRLVGPYFQMAPRPPVSVKGKAAPLVPYHVIAESRISTRFEAARERGLKTYVGRARELQTLRSCLAKALTGEGRFVTVEGEPGIGKSRLLYEFLAGLDREEITVSQGRCQSYGSDVPYFPFLDALRRGLYLTEYASHAEGLDKAVSNIRQLDASLERYLPYLLHLLSIPSTYTLPPELKGESLRRALEEAMVAVLTAVSRTRPIVFVIEDWHWSDAASQSALRHLVRLIPSHRLMCVMSYRLGFGFQIGELGYRTAIRLEALNEAEAEDLLRSVTGAQELPRGLGALVCQSADGNPLFIEEACYSLLESQAMSVSGGRLVLYQPLEQLMLPDTVQAVIRARLDRLDERAQSLVGVASVIGRVFSQRILERIDSGPASLAQTLQTLHAQELIRQTRVLPEPEYTFKHVLTREVAYEGLSHQRRKRLHESVAQAIEEVYPERLEQNAPILAYHYARSARTEKAIHYALRAGESATRLYANAEAATYYDDALMLAATMPKSPEADRFRIDAILGRVAVGTGPRGADDERDKLQQAHALAAGLDDRRRMAQTLYWLGRNYYVAAELRRAIEYAQRSLQIADELGDPALGAGPVNLMGRAYWQLSDFVRSAQMMERSVEQMALLGNRSEEATAAGFVSALFGYMGKFEKALEYSDRSIRLAKELKNPYAEAANFHYRGIIRDQQGRWDSAVADYATAQSIAGRAGDTLRVYMAKFMEGRARDMAGDHAGGRNVLQESVSLADSTGTTFLLGQAKSFLAACCLADGEVKPALSLCAEAIALAEKAGDKFTQALALREFSEVLRAPGPHMDRAKARQSLLEAIRLQEEIQAKPELGRSHASLAKLARAEGSTGESDEQLRTAKRLFAELGMQWDIARANSA